MLELEGARADGRIVMGVLRDWRIDVVEMLGQDRPTADVKGVQKGRIRLFEPEHHGLGIGRRDRFHVGHQGAGTRRVGQDLGVGEHHIVGRERLAVVPAHVGLQMEGVGQLVGRDFPGFRQAGLRLEIERVRQQAFVDFAGDQLRHGHLLQGNVQVGGLGIQNGAQHAAVLWRRGFSEGDAPDRQRAQGQGECGNTGQNSFHGFPCRCPCQAWEDGSRPHHCCMKSASVVATLIMLSTDTHSSKPCTLRALGP